MFKKYELVGFFFTSILGCLLHFVYEWTGENIIAAIFSATDESTFQHLKLFFFPYLLWIFVEQRKFGSIAENLLPAKAIGALCGTILIVVLFYGYTAILGTNTLVLDIAVFLISTGAAYLVSYMIVMNKRMFSSKAASMVGGCVLLLMTVSFVAFTFYPPDLELFRDPTL